MSLIKPFELSIPKGKLIAVGGAEDKGTDLESGEIQRSNLNFFELGILRRVVEEAGGTPAPVTAQWVNAKGRKLGKPVIIALPEPWPVEFPAAAVAPPVFDWAVRGDAATRPNLITSIYMAHEDLERHNRKLPRHAPWLFSGASNRDAC